MLAALFLSAVAFGPPTSTVRDTAKPFTSTSLISRRAIGAAIPAIFLGATAAEAAPGDIRKANQDAIGVSRVKIPAQAEGAKGAGVLPVKIDTAGWKGSSGKQEAVIGPSGAAGGSPNGFLCLGDRDCYKKSEQAAATAAAKKAAAAAQ